MVPKRIQAGAMALACLVVLAACHPRNTRTTRLTGEIGEVRSLSLPGRVTVTGLSVLLVNHGRSDERIRRYFLKTPEGEETELLTSGDFRDRFSDQVKSWGRMGLPTVLPAGSSTKGWLFFRSVPSGSRLVFRLLNTYGTAEKLAIPVAPGGVRKP